LGLGSRSTILIFAILMALVVGRTATSFGDGR
jgi:hypothetical protein